MAHLGGGGGRQTDEYGNQHRQTDEYGNQARRQTDEYGNPINTGTKGNYGTTEAFGTGGQQQHGQDAGLRRSGSSSSSSSEDDGLGGRRKKGMKEKIKEKLPGGRKEQSQYDTGCTTAPGGTGDYGYSGVGEQQEKKGMMEKIKEKLPGGHGRGQN